MDKQTKDLYVVGIGESGDLLITKVQQSIIYNNN